VRRPGRHRPAPVAVSFAGMLNQLVRYAPVVELIRELPIGTLLDVGSGSTGIAPWLDDHWRITAVDADFTDYGSAAGPPADGVSRLVGDARRLPFEDGAFDVVLALDLVEHIAPPDRASVLREVARVARRRAIVGCPAGSAALEADRRLFEQYRRRGERPPGWIDEHLEHGFPEPAELQDGLAGEGSVRLIGNESVRAHSLVMRAEAGGWSAHGANGVDRVLRWAVRRDGRVGRAGDAIVSLVRGRDRGSTYRTIAVLDK
jgi:SAM-dependent methyltransferase